MAKSGGKRKKPDRATLEREVLQAMHDEGWLAPETESDVARAEAQLAAEKIQIPASFENPRDLLRRARKIRTNNASAMDQQHVEARENLARAAREGGTIAPEIEERMRRDRDAAEGKNSDK
jgi:hypothetical protein